MSHRWSGLPLRGRWLAYFVVGAGLFSAYAATQVLPDLAFQHRVRRGAAQSQLGAFRAALLRYVADNGAPPTTQQGLAALVEAPRTPPALRSWSGYLPAIPPDPWGHAYGYSAPEPPGKAFQLLSYGADGRPGGAVRTAIW